MATPEHIAIVDDNEDSRETLSDDLEIGNFTPHELTGGYADFQSLISEISKVGEAAICDHHLIPNYSPRSGAEISATLYSQQFPAILYTAWSTASMDEIRPHRRQLPVLVTPEEACPDVFARGWEQCRNEFSGTFSAVRRPWRSSVLVEDVDGKLVYVTIPGWNSKEVVRFPIRMLPPGQCVHAGDRFFAVINKGAEDQSELYFDEFEFPV